MTALKMRIAVASHWKLAMTNWEDHQSWSSTQEAAEELNINHSMVVQHLKQIGKVKKLSKWVPHELIANQRKLSFWSVIFSYSTQ